MSRYLIDRISALPNVEIHVGMEVTELTPSGAALASATVRDRASGNKRVAAAVGDGAAAIAQIHGVLSKLKKEAI